MTLIIKLPGTMLAILVLLSAAGCAPPTSVYDPTATTTTTVAGTTTTTTTGSGSSSTSSTTTPPSTTTTTVPPATTTTVSNSTTTTVSNTTTTSVSSTSSSSTSSTSSTSTTLPLASYNVGLSIDSNVGLVAALDLSVDFTGSSGFFDVASENIPDCTLDSAMAGVMFTGNRSNPTSINLAFIHVTGFATPTDIVTCTLSSNVAVSLANFSATVNEATDSSSAAIVPTPTISISLSSTP